jgi:hypothetical protein
LGPGGRYSSKVREDFVSQGICFLHHLSNEEKSAGCELEFEAFCAELLVIDALLAELGATVALASLSRGLSMVRDYFGAKEPAKGIFFQHLTASQLVVEGERGATLGGLLDRWGVLAEASRLAAWLTPARLQAPVLFKRVVRDVDGTGVARLVGSLAAQDRVLVLQNAARAEYIGQVGEVLVTAGCRFLSDVSDTSFRDNIATTRVDHMYLTRDGEANKQYAKQRRGLLAALEARIALGDAGLLGATQRAAAQGGAAPPVSQSVRCQ